MSCGFKVEAHISWSHGGIFWEQAVGLTSNAMFGVDKIGCGSSVAADVVESVSKAVVERGFGESAGEEVVSIRV